MPFKSHCRPVAASKTIVLTGASGGIGTIVTQKLLDQGHVVVALSRTAPDIWHEARTHIRYDAANLHDIGQINKKISEKFSQKLPQILRFVIVKMCTLIGSFFLI